MSRRRTPGFGHRGGTGMTNAELAQTLHTTQGFTLPVDCRRDDGTLSMAVEGDQLEITIVNRDGVPDTAYLSLGNECGDICDIVLTHDRVRALVTFLQEQFA